MIGTRIGRYAVSLAAVSLLTLSGVGAAEMNEDMLVKALTPPKTRSLSMSVNSKADEAFVDTLRKNGTRSLTAPDRAKLQAVVADKPQTDLTLEFDYNSAVLRADTIKTADMLGKALSNPELKDKTFVLAGHTDAKGTDDLNQRLSERRADAVKQYLVKTYNLKPENLISVGFGKSQLRNQTDPFSEENRRVQTVNILPYQSAGK